MTITRTLASAFVCSLLFAAAVAHADSAAAQIAPPQRHIALDGIHNLRDLGGYQTGDGRSVRWGVLYRSSDLTDASAQDRSKLAALGIDVVCDLRSDKERALRADPQVGHARSDDRCHSADVNTQGLRPTPNQPTDWREVMKGFYRGMGKQYAPHYRALFDDLKQNKSVLLHCTAGKDRTGVGSALILIALGVPRETVVADYHLTDQFPPPAEVLSAHAELAKIPALKEAHPDYLQAALDGIDKDYGSLDNYFGSALHVSAADREQLRRFYLQAER